MAIERRLTSSSGRSAGSCTRRARATTRWSPTSRCTRASARRGAERDHGADGDAARACRGAHRLADARLHAPAARAAGLPRPPPARLLLDAPARPRALRVRRGPDLIAAARRGRACRRQLRHRPRHGRAGARLLACRPNSIDAVSGRDFVLDYLGAAATCSTHLSRLGAELVLWCSAEFGFCELPDAWSVDLLDHAAEEEPRRGGAAAREGAARGRPPGGVPRRDARAAADVQQGSAGGQGAPVRRCRHAAADARRRARDGRGRELRSRAHARGSRRRADRGHGRGRPARAPGHALPRGPRGGRRPRAQRARQRASRCRS